jgi:hypothetical protein
MAGLYAPLAEGALAEGHQSNAAFCGRVPAKRALSPSGLAARRDAPIDDHALPAGRFFDCDQAEPLRKPYSGTRLGSADIGALGDPCDR